MSNTPTSRWNSSQKSILAIVTVSSFLGTFLISSINIALPAIEAAFDMNAVSLSWLITSFLLASAMFLLPLGRWADLNGIRRVYKCGIVSFSVITLLCGLSPNGWALIVCRFLQGAGSAMTMSTGTAILVSMFPGAQRGRVLGISVAAVYLGLAMGPFLGGIITQQLGWRYIFYISSVLSVVATAITFVFMGKDDRPTHSTKISLKGTLVYAPALVALIYGSSIIPKTEGWILIGAGILLLMLFFMIEKRSANPVINISLFTQNRLFAYSNFAALINYTATFAIVFLLSLYLQKIKAMTPQQAGSILLVQPLVMSLFSPVTGRLSDTIQPRLLATTGMLLCTAGLAFFAFLGENTSITLIIVVLIVVGLGFSLFSSPNMNTIMSSVPKHQYGLASGISSTMRVFGQMVSMTIATLLFALFFGKNKVAEISMPVFMTTVSILFIIFAAICAVGIWFSYQRGNISRNEK
jgi:EmrB/QacA subfamily drug resistance transporter